MIFRQSFLLKNLLAVSEILELLSDVERINKNI